MTNTGSSADQHRLVRGMCGRALRLQEDIKAQTGVRFVQPVVVFWNDFQARQVMGNNVVFVHGDQRAGSKRNPPRSLRRWSPA